MPFPGARSIPWPQLLLLTLATAAIEGYHLGTDDAEVYLAAVNRAANPRLYPFGAEFFLAQTRLSLFAPLVGGSARLLHVPADVAVLAWYLVTLFLLLLAAWRISQTFFPDVPSRWAAVATLAALLPAPVAGTALVGADNYLTARSFSTPFALLAVDAALRGQFTFAGLWLLATALIHPLMAVYAAVLLFLLWLFQRPEKKKPSFWRGQNLRICLFCCCCYCLASCASANRLDGFSLHSAQGIYRELLYSRTYFFAQLWQWYEWTGVLIPLAILAALTSRARPPALRITSRALLLLGSASTVAFLILSSTPALESLTRLQPMRSFQLLYLLLFLILGGLLGGHILKHSHWRWVLVFLPLAAGMFALDRTQYPASPHLELPGGAPANPWLQVFLWIRANTPEDAVFAMEPNLMAIPGEDRHGFRALARRSALADHYKDSGPATMFPALAPEWQREQQLQQGWRSFGPAAFVHLAQQSSVRWVLVQPPQDVGLICPYRNQIVAVCRIEPR